VVDSCRSLVLDNGGENGIEVLLLLLLLLLRRRRRRQAWR